jgi:NAD(P)-dependent dehydrogenase (short-subunit alcohol dehydrogenase family)
MSAQRHVLITGSSTGIGRACAVHLASRGWQVWAGIRSAADAASILREAPSCLEPVTLDVTDAASIAIAAERLRTATGPAGLAALVNNAGISVSGPLELIDTAGLRRQFEVNVFGHLAVTRAMLPLLRAHAEPARGPHPARIVMISSIAGRMSQPILGPYCASKFALESLSDSLRMELASQRIGVSIIEPGAVQSEIWNKGLAQADSFNLAEPAAQRYESLLVGLSELARHAQQTAIPAIKAARLVERCLTARRPPVRILLGRDARAGALLKSILPTRAFDSLLVGLLSRTGRRASRR